MTAVFIQLLRRTRIGQAFLDIPNARGLHGVPVPRIGGIALFACVWLLAGWWIQRDPVAAIALISVVLLAISLVDDLRPLSTTLRLLVHAGAALLTVLLWVNTFGLAPGQLGLSILWVMSPAGALAIALAIVWMTNLYNFMDGADGVAGGMSVIGFGTYATAWALHTNPDGSLGFLATAIAGASLDF